MARVGRIEDLQPDDKNANRHTERGLGLLEKSLRKYGAGRSILVDRDGRVIAGNATLEAAAEMGLGVRVVETDGRELVVVQRNDLSLDDPKARELAVADNRVAQVDLDFDPAVLKELAGEGADLSDFWTPGEMEELMQKLALPADEEKAPGEPGGAGYSEQYGVIVICQDEQHQKAVFDQLVAEGHKVRVVVT